MCKKHSDLNAPDAALSSLGLGVYSMSSLTSLGAAIYGQLVTFDQLSQLGHHHHHQQRKQQQQQQLTGTKTVVTTTSSPPPQSPPAPALACATTSSSLLNVMSASAYANLDPSYSLKGKSSATVAPQQQPMEVEAMELSSSSGSPLSATGSSIANASVNNAYSYPTFPYCTATSSATVTTTVAAVSTAAATAVPAPSADAIPFGRLLHQQQPPPPPPQRLLVRMSVKLIQTYETINEVYFRKKRRREQACEENLMKRDRKGGHEAAPAVTIANANIAIGHCCLLTGSGSNSGTNTTSSRSCCCQMHHGRAANGAAAAAAWNANAAPNSFQQQQQQQQQHLYDVGNRQQQQQPQQQQKVSCQAFPVPPPPPPPAAVSNVSATSSNVITVPRSVQAAGASSNSSSSSSNRLLRHQGANDFLKIGSVWMDRYEITDIKGKGTFGQVFRAHDRKTHEEVAIKVIKNRRQFLAQAEIEIKLLREIARFQENEQRAAEVGANYVVNLKGYFTYQGHWCLVFECLSYNLYELLTYTHFRGVSLHLTLKFARQLCAALVFLSRPDVRVMHCDLKPENILLVTPKRSDLKVIDFGSSCHINENVHQYIQSRFYRAPEVLLNLDYGLSIDMWSLGCILVEMHTGEPLFSGSNELEQLLQIVEVLGLPPLWMLEKSPKLEHFFERVNDFPPATTTSTTASSTSLSTTMTSVVSTSSVSSTSSSSSTTSSQDRMDTTSIASAASVPGGTNPPSTPPSPLSKACVTIRGIVYRPRRIYTKGNMTMKCRFQGPHTRPLQEVLGRDTGGPAGRRQNEEGHAPEDYDKFIDLVQKMLVYDPRHRIKPDEALTHRFFERKSSSASVSSATVSAGSVPAEGHSVTNTTVPTTVTTTSANIVPPSTSTPLIVVPKRFAEEVPPPTIANTSGGGGSPAYLTFAPNQPDQSSTTQSQQQLQLQQQQ
ncbi:unnamed protein product [Taenia asiatica]|uniref:Protein kinase domain-containing protein n=1 Tax=Taenia asiatica TaxID=60517 RepID=A0A158R6I3_TAEAS|nr:unnamed protein product [Taenia asiatica]